MDQETWRFINTFAPWLSALGTFTAVWVSLYLARKTNRADLILSFGIRFLGVSDPESRVVVSLSITNVGLRSATVNKIFFRALPWRKRGSVWVPPRNAYSSAFPITLADGQSANYFSAVPEFERAFAEGFSNELQGFPGRPIRMRLLRIYVGTSTGDLFHQKPEQSLLRLMQQSAITMKTASKVQNETLTGSRQ
jgi:hypothetical protein